MALRGRKYHREGEEESKVIEIAAEMQGTLNFKDNVNLKINGNFKGTLDTRGTLTVGEQAKVEADINGDNIVIAGNVRGNITANKMLVLMPTAVLYGDITTPKLNIVEGAVFQGLCKMHEGGQLNMEEVARYLEIDNKEIEDLANSGKIPATRAGNTWKFDRTQIDNWASSGRLK